MDPQFTQRLVRPRVIALNFREGFLYTFRALAAPFGLEVEAWEDAGDLAPRLAASRPLAVFYFPPSPEAASRVAAALARAGASDLPALIFTETAEAPPGLSALRLPIEIEALWAALREIGQAVLAAREIPEAGRYAIHEPGEGPGGGRRPPDGDGA
jgi:hypothetical protein